MGFLHGDFFIRPVRNEVDATPTVDTKLLYISDRGSQEAAAETKAVCAEVRQEFSFPTGLEGKNLRANPWNHWSEATWFGARMGPLRLAISCRFKRAWNFITFALFKQITQFVNLKDKLGETRIVVLPCLRRPCFSFIKSPVSQHH